MNAEFWFGLFAPAGTPDDVVDRLYTLFSDAAKTQGASDVMQSMAAAVTLGTGDELAARVQADLEVMKVLTEEIGIAQ